MKNKAIVFNLFYNGLGVVRALGKNGIDVIGLDSEKNPVGKYSKYLSKFYQVPDPSKNETAFISSLIDIGSRFCVKAILFPTNDSWSIAISKNHKLIKKYFFSYNPSYEIINKIINKKEFYNLMHKNRILVPKTYSINNIEDFKLIRNSIKYPVILKPNSRNNINMSTKVFEIYQKNRVITIHSEDELIKHINLIINYKFVLYSTYY